jgi:hypothetical protein
MATEKKSMSSRRKTRRETKFERARSHRSTCEPLQGKSGKFEDVQKEADQLEMGSLPVDQPNFPKKSEKPTTLERPRSKRKQLFPKTTGHHPKDPQARHHTYESRRIIASSTQPPPEPREDEPPKGQFQDDRSDEVRDWQTFQTISQSRTNLIDGSDLLMNISPYIFSPDGQPNELMWGSSIVGGQRVEVLAHNPNSWDVRITCVAYCNRRRTVQFGPYLSTPGKTIRIGEFNMPSVENSTTVIIVVLACQSGNVPPREEDRRYYFESNLVLTRAKSPETIVD